MSSEKVGAVAVLVVRESWKKELAAEARRFTDTSSSQQFLNFSFQLSWRFIGSVRTYQFALSVKQVLGEVPLRLRVSAEPLVKRINITFHDIHLGKVNECLVEIDRN
jgi:hypothetical protein